MDDGALEYSRILSIAGCQHDRPVLCIGIRFDHHCWNSVRFELRCGAAYGADSFARKNSTSRAEDNIAYSISRGGLCRSQSHPSRYHGLLTALPTPFEPFIPPIPSIARAVMFAAKNKGEKAYLLRCCEYCWRVKRNSGLEHGLWCFCAGCMLAKLQQYLYSLIITTLSGCSGGRELLNSFIAFHITF